MPIGPAYKIFDPLLTPTASVLDYGCGPGKFLRYAGARIGEGIGVDLDTRSIQFASQHNPFPHVTYLHADAKAELPFPSARFDLIVAFGVMEHVGNEAPYIKEFHRLLRPGGSLVIDVPSNGPFRIFDVGNVKYNFPRVHRWFYYYVARQPEYYERNFGPKAPMFGQFSRDASEHKHYTARDVEKMVQPYFTMERYTHYALFFELIQFFEVLACKPFGRTTGRFFAWLTEQDCKLVSPWGRANFVGIFRRRD